MITLVFDTCLDKMYVALKKDGNFLSSKVIENHDNKYHSAFLISTIKGVLRDNNLRPENIDLIGVNIGPGSFTGIRACVTTARVMAQQLNCKTIGVSSLEILSKAYNKKDSIVALDARKNCAYLFKDNEIKGAVPIEEISTAGLNVLTDDKLQKILNGESYQSLNLPLGEVLADIAEEKVQNLEADWRFLKPLYIQPPPMG